MTTPADDAALAAGAFVQYAIDNTESPADDAGASILDTYLPGDNLFGSQWYLNNTGSGYDINIASAWDDYTGRGVKVAVLDDGFDYLHSDLVANYDTSLDIDIKDSDGDAFALSGNNHGTQVMGVIGAVDNGSGIVGVASGATMVGIRQGVGASGSVAQISEAFATFDQFDVVNNSWTYTGYFFDNFDTLYFATIANELIDAVDNGRDGLGTVVVFAAGNSGADGQNVNYHAFQNSPFTITVGGMTTAGTPSSTSTPGAAVLVAAPMNNILTTDRSGGAGSNSTDHVSVSGTSFSAPMVSGVAALMLEADSALGYRDV